MIIGIAGGTGSGKSTVVRKIIDSLPKDSVAVVSQDNYYKDSSHLPWEERRAQNFDEPRAFDWELLYKDLSLCRGYLRLYGYGSYSKVCRRQYKAGI